MLVDELMAGLTPANHALAIKLASIPDDIRGYGHVKDAHLEKAKKKEADLLHQWRNPEAMKGAAQGRGRRRRSSIRATICHPMSDAPSESRAGGHLPLHRRAEWQSKPRR